MASYFSKKSKLYLIKYIMFSSFYVLLVKISFHSVTGGGILKQITVLWV